MPLNSTRAFENEHDRLLEKLQQLREAAKPFVALRRPKAAAARALEHTLGGNHIRLRVLLDCRNVSAQTEEIHA